jgi:hypothetical protein
VQRRVSQRGFKMGATRRIHVGMIHAHKIATVTASDHSFHLAVDGEASRNPPDHRQRDPWDV